MLPALGMIIVLTYNSDGLPAFKRNEVLLQQGGGAPPPTTLIMVKRS